MTDIEVRARDFALVAMQTRVLSEVISSAKTGRSFSHDYLAMYRQTYHDTLTAFASQSQDEER